MKRILKVMITVASCLALSNCASFGGKFDKEKVEKIRSIAVVGFTFDSPLETSGHIMSALMGNEKSIGNGMFNSKSERTESETMMSKKVYEEILANFKKVGWKVATAKEVQSSASVKAFYSKSVKIGMLPLEKGTGRYEKSGIPQYIHVAALAGEKEFAKMARELGVDAVAIVYVKSKSSQSIPFVTNISHSADVLFQIFDPISDDLSMLFSSNGREVEGVTKTKIGKEFLEGVEKGALASIDQFGDDLQKRLKQ